MKRILLLVLGAFLVANLACGEEFSRGLSPDDFAAAGLNKLTPAELARLNELVAARLAGKVEQARQEASRQAATEVQQRVAAEVDQRVQTEVKQRVETEVQQRVEAEVHKRVEAEVGQRVKAEVAKKEKEGLLHKMRVVLTPGTEVNYATIESTLVGPFRGYDPGTVFTLANGQKWRVLDGSYWSPKSEANQVRKVVIKPGLLGSFYMDIAGAGRAKVEIVFRPKEKTGDAEQPE